MQIFAFDLLPYAEHLDHLKAGKELRERMNNGDASE